MEPHLRRTLGVDNSWLDGEPRATWLARHVPASFVPRRLRLELDPRVAGERVAVVVGPRQSGKSTLIWSTLTQANRDTLYLNCEEPVVRDWLRSPAAFLADLKEWLGEIPNLFFEEIQHLAEAGLFLKGLVDRRIGRHIFATGSSSFDLEAKTRESLAGRARRYLLLPLSIGEIGATFEGSKLLRARQLEQAVGRMAVFGSYPSVYAGGSLEELAGLVEAFVVRDVSDRFRIQHTAAFRRILELAASQIGNLVNASEWAALVGVSNDTVAEHVRLLEETHVLRLVRPYVGGKRAEITSARKVYFIDNGIRNQLFGGFGELTERADRGALLENLAFSELAKSTNPLLDTISYWRSKSGAEVDFVVQHQGRLLACEVKAGAARGKLSRSAHSFIDAYAPELFLIVCREPQPATLVGTTEVRFLALPELAPVVEGFVGR
ncbi:MAG: ATP-binding protein [Thermoanaerobaculia bacterium]|nr:ATP-binding protein [Thermoanaerobaculia bacterium]